ncbi:hypothetical protein KFE25_001702 [Diacronema lutheri]|uniref:D-3-phosphoglycerate dehydrogenase n=2 Tax=Diacronema lutheri TaxID=2081491 RepID=A0A8J5XEA3_DIALT|nr:hypothetical protein KFE25_001702 [Diacronema lutheri]
MTISGEKRVLISDPTDKICADVLIQAGVHVDQKQKLSEAELAEIIKDYDGLIVRSGTTVTATIIEAAHRLKVIGRAGTGVDNIDCDAATRKGVMVMNTPGGNTISAAEHTCALIMSLARNVAQGDASMKAHKWERKNFMGVELMGKTLGVLGLGRVGREVVSRCQAFGMKVVGYDPMFPEDASRKLAIEPVSAAECIRRADFLTVHVPLLDETRNLINADSLATTKPGVRIVNCARGGIIDEAALLAALESGHVAGAGLDVFESEPPAEHEWALIKHPRVISTPHLGASTEEAQGKVAQEIAEQFVNLFSGKTVSGVVNAPDLTLSQRPELQPWTALCDKMGSLVAQTLSGGQVSRVHCAVAGPAVGQAGSLCVASALTGIFGALTGERLNLINAPIVAREREIAISHEVAEETVYHSLVTLTVHAGTHAHTIAGTVFGKSTGRIVMLNGHSVEFPPDGYLLIYKNIDKPGVLASVASCMAANNVNIGTAIVSPRDAEGVVTSIMSLDKKLDKAVLVKAKALPDVSELHLVHV